MNKDINPEFEEIIKSIDGIKRAQPPDFFYARLKARMEQELPGETKKSLALRPVYVFTMLLLVFAVNAVAILSSKKNIISQTVFQTEIDILQTIALEYNPSELSGLYDLNDKR